MPFIFRCSRDDWASNSISKEKMKAIIPILDLFTLVQFGFFLLQFLFLGGEPTLFDLEFPSVSTQNKM